MKMSFSRWENYDACILEQKDAGHDQESAKKICDGIKERAEKGELYKSADQQNYDIICKSDAELVIGGFASWELVDPENDLITAEAQAKYLQKLFKLPSEYRNIMVGHGNFKIGEPLLKYTKDGQEYFSHVNEKGLYLVSKIRNDGFKTTQKWREKILKGEMSMYSIAGLPLESEFMTEGGTKIRKVHDIEPWEITVCEKGVNPKAEFKILAKETPANKCDVSKCHSECCRHIALKVANSGSDFEKYASNHGITVKSAENGVSWIRLPIICKELDQDSNLCKSYSKRPELCRNYPLNQSSPFIEKTVCVYSVGAGFCKSEETPVLKRVEKRGNRWCVVHCHGENAGEPIKCFDTEEEAQAMHAAMQANKSKQESSMLNLEKATQDEIEKILLEKYRERSEIERLLYPQKMEASVKTPTTLTSEPPQIDPIKEKMKEELNNRLNLLRVEIWALEEALKQKILALNKGKPHFLQDKSEVEEIFAKHGFNKARK